MMTPEKGTKMHVQALEAKGLKHKVTTMQDKLEMFLHDCSSSFPHALSKQPVA